MLLLTSNEMKDMDRVSINFFGMSEKVLMENAGRAATCYFLEIFGEKINGCVGILVGHGNNGGDALVLARYLRQKNISVVVFLLTNIEKIKSKVAIFNLDLLLLMGVPVVELLNTRSFNNIKSELKKCIIWVDGIFGIGLKASVKGLFAEVIFYINSLKNPIFAIDIPSGLNSDTGQVCGVSINAHATITFAFPKVGHFLFPGPNYVGKLKVVDIGIPHICNKYTKNSNYVLNFSYVKNNIKIRAKDAHKGTNGHLAIIAGELGKSGAAIIASLAAMRSGAGLVTLYLPKKLVAEVDSIVAEVMTAELPEMCYSKIDDLSNEIIDKILFKKRSILFGPGVGNRSDNIFFLKKLLKRSKIPVIIDADGISILSVNNDILKDALSPIILTPHPGEMSYLTGKSVSYIQKNRVVIARDFAIKFGVYVVLKGIGTIIAHPDGKVYINVTGNSGMGSGGMGDALSGILASFIVQGYSIEFAIGIAVYIHGLSGDDMASMVGPYGYLATDLITNIPKQLGLTCFSKGVRAFSLFK